MIEKLSKINILNTVLFSLTSMVIGCSTVTYEEPKSGPVARVRFVSDADSITIVRSYKSKECDDENEMMRLRNGFLLNSDPRRLNMPLWDYHENAAKEFFVRSGIAQVYIFESTHFIKRLILKCGVFLEQKFDEGKDYELSYHWNKYNCHLNVYEIKENNSGESEKILLNKISNKLPENFSKTCLTKFKGSRWD